MPLTPILVLRVDGGALCAVVDGRFHTALMMSLIRSNVDMRCHNQPCLLAEVDRVFLSRSAVLCASHPGLLVSSRLASLVMQRRGKARSRHKRSFPIRTRTQVLHHNICQQLQIRRIHDIRYDRSHPCSFAFPGATRGPDGKIVVSA